MDLINKKFPAIFTVEEAIAETLKPYSDTTQILSVAQTDRLDNITTFLTKLTTMLHEKGVLNEQDILNLISPAFSKVNETGL